MALGLYSLLEGSLLIINAIAVLNKERFLFKYNFGQDQQFNQFGQQPGVKAQLFNLVNAVQTVLRVPLIFVNIVVIVLKLFFG